MSLKLKEWKSRIVLFVVVSMFLFSLNRVNMSFIEGGNGLIKAGPSKK